MTHETSPRNVGEKYLDYLESRGLLFEQLAIIEKLKILKEKLLSHGGGSLELFENTESEEHGVCMVAFSFDRVLDEARRVFITATKSGVFLIGTDTQDGRKVSYFSLNDIEDCDVVSDYLFPMARNAILMPRPEEEPSSKKNGFSILNILRKGSEQRPKSAWRKIPLT